MTASLIVVGVALYLTGISGIAVRLGRYLDRVDRVERAEFVRKAEAFRLAKIREGSR